MFSKIKIASKNEIRGVFRSMFKLNDDPNFEPKRKNAVGKSSISKRFKARFSSFRMSQRKPEFDRDEGDIYDKLSSPQIDKINLTVSSILKKSSSSSRSYKKKKIRFIDEDTLHDNYLNEKNAADETHESTVLKESDVAYYKKLKEEIIDRNKEFHENAAIKRKASNAMDIQAEYHQEKNKKLDDRSYYNPLEAPGCNKSNDSNGLIDINHKHGICTYFIEPKKNPWIAEKPPSLNETERSLSINLKLWPNDNDDIFIDELSSSSFETIISRSNSAFGDIAQFSWIPDGYERKYRNKITPIKKSLKYRFDPILRSTSCGVSLLSKQKSNIDQMSWCST